jgi:hypothetical protein
MNILIYLKGVGAQIVIWTFYDQVVKVEKGWVEQEFVLLIISALPNETGLPNELISYRIKQP